MINHQKTIIVLSLSELVLQIDDVPRGTFKFLKVEAEVNA
jgi:hypothetical protein